MRFRDQRQTLVKGQPLPGGWQMPFVDGLPYSVPATPRRLAPPDRDPATLMPMYNRASRRALGRYRTWRRAAIRRKILRPLLKPPLPWKQDAAAEAEAAA